MTAKLKSVPAPQPTNVRVLRKTVTLDDSIWAEIDEIRRERAVIPPINDVVRELIVDALAKRRAARRKP